MKSVLKVNIPVGISSIIVVILFCSNQFFIVNAQYDSVNHLCGGWFHSTNGSIRFNYTGMSSTDFPDRKDQVCIWTLNPDLITERTGYTIRIQKIAGLNCTPENVVTVTHFNHRSKDVTASESWNCGGPQQWVNVPGTVMVVVLRSETLRNGTGFHVEWEESGSYLNRTGLRTMYYSWGKHSVEPLPYFAAGFTSNEIATFAFPKGNGTSGYKLEMTFDNIKFCPNAGLDTCPDNVVLVFGIQPNGRLNLLATYEDEQIQPPAISSSGGIFILVWVADYPRAGLSFQLKYFSVRE